MVFSQQQQIQEQPTEQDNEQLQMQQQSQYHDHYDDDDRYQQHPLSLNIQEEYNTKLITATKASSPLTRNENNNGNTINIVNITDCHNRHDAFSIINRYIHRFLISKLLLLLLLLLLLFIVTIHMDGKNVVDAKVTTTTVTEKVSFALRNMRIIPSKTTNPFLIRNKSINNNKIFFHHNNIGTTEISSSLSVLQIRKQQLHKQYQNRITAARRIRLNSLLYLPRGGGSRQDDDEDDDDEDEQNYDEDDDDDDDDDDMLFDSNDMMMNDNDDGNNNNFMEDPSSQTNIVSRFLDTWNNKTPPITKWYLSCSVIITLYSYIFNKNQYPTILLYNGKIQQLLIMPWKFITAFFYFGPLSIGYCMTLQFLYVYMSTLERLNYYKPYDFIIMILFGQTCMIFGYTILQLNSQLLGHNLSTYLVYIWSRYHEGLEVNMFELFNTKAEYLPWFFIAQTYLLENEIPILDILGILFGHIYHHYYTHVGILHAPIFIKNWYEHSTNPIAIKFRKLYQSVSTDFEH